MASLSDFGIAAPPANPTIYTAPVQADNASIPTLQGPQLPAVQQFNVPPSSINDPNPTENQPESNIPTLADIVTSTEKKNGKPLSKDEFGDLASWYRTNVAGPLFWQQKGATKAKVDAELQSYDDVVNREANKRYANQSSAANKDDSSGALGAFLTAAKGSLERVGAGSAAIVGGASNILASKMFDTYRALGIPIPKDWDTKFGDALMAQANPELNSDAKAQLDNLTTQRDKLLQFYGSNPQAAERIHAELDPQIARLSQVGNDSNLINTANQNINTAFESGHPIAATAGVVGGQLLPFFLGGGPLGVAGVAGTEAIGNVGANAAEQLGSGTPLAKVEAQAIPDVALQTLMAYLPTKFAGGLIKRVAKGAGTAGGVAAIQQVIDKAINDKNQISPESIGVAAGLGGALSALHGSGVSKLLDRFTKEKTNTSPSKSSPGVAPKTNAKSETDVGTEIPEQSPREAYSEILNNNVTAEGLPDNEFDRVSNGIAKKAELLATKKYKVNFKSIDSPETLVAAAIKLSKQLTGNSFDKMTPEQREGIVGNVSAWLAKRTKIEPQAVSDTITSFRTVQPTESAAPVTPPSEAPAQTAPETATPPTQAAVTPPAQVGYKPIERYDPLWTAASTSTIPLSQLPQEMRGLAGMVRSGRIPDRQAFDKILQDAESRKGNTLKAEPKTQTKTIDITPETEAAEKSRKLSPKISRNPDGATSLNPPETKTKNVKPSEITTGTDNEDRVVGDILGSRSNKSNEVSLRAQLRAMLKASGAKGDELAGLKKLTVKGLREKAKAIKNKQILAKTRVEPVENPDEVKPSKNKLKKQAKPKEPSAENKVDRAATDKYAADNSIPQMFMRDAVERLGLKPDEVKAVWNRYKEAGLATQDKKNPNNYKLQNQALAKEGMIRSTLEQARKDGDLKESPPPKTEAPAKENVGANKQTPLEKLLQERLGDRLPKNRLDEIHDAVETAQAGDKNSLTDLIQGLKDSGDITKADAKWLKDLPKRGVAHDLVENNASGESSASLEAQHRIADERARGRTRAVVRRNDTVEPMTGVDAVDVHARHGELVVQRGVGKDEWTILSQGDDLSRDVAIGKLNRVRSKLNNLHEEMQAGRGEKESPISEDTISPKKAEELYLDRQKNLEGTAHEPERIAPLNVKREVDKIIDGIREGSDAKETGRSLVELSNRLEEKRFDRALKGMRARRRGPEWVKARLQRLVADSDPQSDHARAAKMAIWLVDKNPAIADDLAISINSRMEGAGFFSPFTNIIGLNARILNDTTGLHELLHASERLLPENLQNKIRGEYIGRIQNKLKKTTNEWARAYLKNAIRNFVTPNNSDRLAMFKILKEHSNDVPAKEFYKYFDPSEYWAEEGSSILARRHDAGSWIAKTKQWLSEFAGHIKNLFGLDNNSKIISGLNKILKAEDGTSGMLNKGDKQVSDINKLDPEQVGDEPSRDDLGYEPASDADTDPNMREKPTFNKQTKDLGNFSTLDKGVENLMLAERGLEKTMQFAEREGIKVTEDNNVFDAAYSKRGIANNLRKEDRFEVVGPAEDWLYSNYSSFAKTPKEALDVINKFFGNRNFLERMQTAWMLESPLSGTAEIDRAIILEKVANNEISGKEARKQLTSLVKKNNILDWREYAESKGVDVEKVENNLSALKDKYNVDDDFFKEFNSNVQGIRDRLRKRLIDSGDIDPDDPYVDLYGWKWYVPLKGSPFGGGVDGNFDMIPSRHIALSRLNKQMEIMEGRNSVTEQPFNRLLVDLSRSADRVGNKGVLDKVYNLLTGEDTQGHLNLKKFGAQIDVFHGRAKDGFTHANTGKFVDRLTAPAHGIIINDGATHYVVTLPRGSALLRGLIQMNNIKVPDVVSSTVSKGTNVLARLYTTIDPVWQTTVGFARDISYVPLTLAATRFDNPLQVVPFLLKYIPEVIKSYQALPTIIPTLLGKEGTIRALAEANPDSYAGWIRRYEKAGGSNFFTSGFDIAGVQKTLLSRYEAQDGVLDLTKFGWKKVLEYTGNYANLLEQISRIAAFRQLVKEGMSETEAATQVRKILDYEQSGVYGRVINSWLAFFRVGATGTDAMRRAFTKPTGGIDYAKLAKWQAFMGALGYMGYMGGMSLMGKDDDGKYKIQKVNPDLLTQRVFFPVGDKIGSINLGLGLPQILLAPGVLVAALNQGHISSKQAVKSYFNMLERNGPTSPGGALGDNPTDYIASALFGGIPTIARPIIDTSRNTSSFSSPIHTIDPDRNKYNSDQGYPNTPKEWKDVATWIREHTGGTIDIFPEDIKYWVESYGGRPAVNFTRWAFQSGNVTAGGEAPMGRLAGSFYVDTSHYMARDLFNTLDDLAEDSKRYNHLVSTTMHKEGLSRDQAKDRVASIVNRDRGFAARLQAYKDLKKAHTDYNQAVNALRDNKLMSYTRKQLVRKKLDSKMRTAVEKAQDTLDRAGK